MVDAAIRVIDRLIQLLTIREVNREKYFRNYVEPTFADAETVARDYIKLFQELIARLNSTDEDVSTIISWIETRRTDAQVIRIKLRALIEASESDGTGNFPEPEASYRNAILEVMKGGLSFSEQGHINVGAYLDSLGRVFPHHYPMSHTVLDLLCSWKDSPLEENRDRFVREATLQLWYIEAAWSDVVLSYAKVKNEYL